MKTFFNFLRDFLAACGLISTIYIAVFYMSFYAILGII